MWAVGRLSWQWQEQWVMTESSVGKVKWRVQGSERESVGEKRKGKHREQRRRRGRERRGEGVQPWLARPDHLIGLANQAELTSGWGLWGWAENGKGAREALLPTSPYYHQQKQLWYVVMVIQRKGSWTNSWTTVTVSQLISTCGGWVPRCDCERNIRKRFFSNLQLFYPQAPWHSFLYTSSETECFNTFSQLPNTTPAQSTNQCVRGSEGQHEHRSGCVVRAHSGRLF